MRGSNSNFNNIILLTGLFSSAKVNKLIGENNQTFELLIISTTIFLLHLFFYEYKLDIISEMIYF